MSENNEKLKYIDIQLIITIIFICAISLSFILAYDKKLSLENKQRLFDNETASNLAFMQSLLIIIVAIGFLYINSNQYVISKKYNNADQNNIKIQTYASCLSIIIAFLSMYIVLNSKTFSIAEAENI